MSLENAYDQETPGTGSSTPEQSLESEQNPAPAPTPEPEEPPTPPVPPVQEEIPEDTYLGQALLKIKAIAAKYQIQPLNYKFEVGMGGLTSAVGHFSVEPVIEPIDRLYVDILLRNFVITDLAQFTHVPYVPGKTDIFFKVV